MLCTGTVAGHCTIRNTQLHCVGKLQNCISKPSGIYTNHWAKRIEIVSLREWTVHLGPFLRACLPITPLSGGMDICLL